MSSLCEESEFVHAAVFDELSKVFPEVFQLQRLLQLEWVKAWHGWAEIKSILSGCQNEDVKSVYIEDYVHIFVILCQELLYIMIFLVMKTGENNWKKKDIQLEVRQGKVVIV